MQKQVPRIKPSQRQKKRFVLFEMKSPQRLSFTELSKSLWLELAKKIPKQEAVLLGFQLMVFDSAKGRGIFKCSREKCEKTKSAMNDIKEISGEKVSLKTLKTSGTIKTLKELLEKSSKQQVF